MVKQSVWLIVASTVAMLLQDQLSFILKILLLLHNKVAEGLGIIFSRAPAAELIQALIALIIVPVVIGGIVALILWIFKRYKHAHFMMAVWITWMVILVTLLAQRG